MKIYHYISAKYGLDAIRDQRIKVALFEDLNDPFELFSVSARNRYTRDAIRSVKRYFDSIMGLLCFSKTWRNPVMWSHYADRHKGMVLELDAPDHLLIKMEYRTSRQLVDLRNGLASDRQKKALIMRLIRTKFRHWKYEQEIRMHVGHHESLIDGGLRFYPFGGDLQLIGIYLGPLCKVSDESIANNLPNGCKLMVSSTRLAFQSFRVVHQEREKSRCVRSV